ncbi:MAG: S49 family peptidase [Chloroflexi bacterium]|nr:S49 family peptidase [Chloroflexota bacterium]
MKFPELKWEHVQRGLLWIVLPLLLGVFAASAIPKPVVGIIRLEDAIYSYTANDLLAQIDYARKHPEIRAVVLVLNSPGGTVVDTEAVYLELERLRDEKPLVASVNGMAASGAYYLAVGTDYIYAKPTSEVGNVGVIGYLPPTPFIYEDLISTGPYKLWGSPRDAYLREIEMIKEVFYEAVDLGRGDALKVGPEVILRGQLWTGAAAVDMGIIDAIGTESDAVAKAAEMAHLRNYETADLYDLAGLQVDLAGLFFQTDSEGLSLPYPRQPGLYLLFIPPLPSAAQP